MTKDDSRFEAACLNLAAFIFGSWKSKGYKDKSELWAALPESTKEQIREFIIAPKEGPRRKHD